MKNILYCTIATISVFCLRGMEEKNLTKNTMLGNYYKAKNLSLTKSLISHEEAFKYFEKLFPDKLKITTQNVTAHTKNYFKGDIDPPRSSRTGTYTQFPSITTGNKNKLNKVRLVSFKVDDNEKYGISNFMDDHVFFYEGLQLGKKYNIKNFKYKSESIGSSIGVNMQYFLEEELDEKANNEALEIPIESIAQAYHSLAGSNYINDFVYDCMRKIVFISPRNKNDNNSNRVEYTAGRSNINIAYNDVLKMLKDDNAIFDHIESMGYFQQETLARQIAYLLKDWENPILNGQTRSPYSDDNLELADNLSKKDNTYDKHIENLASTICKKNKKCYSKDTAKKILHYFYVRYFPIFCKNKIDIITRQQGSELRAIAINVGGILSGLICMGIAQSTLFERFTGEMLGVRFTGDVLSAGLGATLALYNTSRVGCRIALYNKLSEQRKLWTSRRKNWVEEKESD